MPKDIGPLTICLMRRTARQMAILGIEKSKAHWILNEIIDEAEKKQNSREFMLIDMGGTDLSGWKMTFLHDFFDKPMSKCKSCGHDIAHYEKRDDVCEYCI
jgi:hypothetical protein